LRLRLLLAFDGACTFEALGARDRRHHRGEVGELLGLDCHELICPIEPPAARPVADWLEEMRASIWVRVLSRFWTAPA